MKIDKLLKTVGLTILIFFGILLLMVGISFILNYMNNPVFIFIGVLTILLVIIGTFVYDALEE